MDMSPNQVRTATFTTARKGYDPDEVTAFLERAADSLENAQNHATAMEARARAAVSKLQEMSAATAPPVDRATEEAHVETISRTLLLAQKAADEALAEARADADRIREEALLEARRAGVDERDRLRSEVDQLAARRDFLHADVEQLESFLLEQRERLRSVATMLVDVAERAPEGLGYVRPPLLSASDDPPGRLDAEHDATPDPFAALGDSPSLVDAVEDDEQGVDADAPGDGETPRSAVVESDAEAIGDPDDEGSGAEVVPGPDDGPRGADGLFELPEIVEATADAGGDPTPRDDGAVIVLDDDPDDPDDDGPRPWGDRAGAPRR